MTTATDWKETQRRAGKALKVLLIEHDLTAVEIGEDLGYSSDGMSAFLLARRRWPNDFEQRFRAAVAARSGQAA